MSIEYYRENDCVGCETCVNCGKNDWYYEAELICDCCGKSVDELYELDGEQFCEDCLGSYVPKITYEVALERRLQGND